MSFSEQYFLLTFLLVRVTPDREPAKVKDKTRRGFMFKASARIFTSLNETLSEVLAVLIQSVVRFECS